MRTQREQKMKKKNIKSIITQATEAEPFSEHAELFSKQAEPFSTKNLMTKNLTAKLFDVKN